MRAKRRALLMVEGLEARLALSTSAGPAPAQAAIVQALALSLSGQIRGTWAVDPAIPDTGMQQSLQGGGRVTTLGQVTADGTLQTPGFVRRGYTEGILTLTDARGNTVTIELKGAASQPGFSPPAHRLRFHVTGGTGAYANAAGHGVAVLTETPEQRPVSTPGGPTPDYIIAPMFTLKLHGARA